MVGIEFGRNRYPDGAKAAQNMRGTALGPGAFVELRLEYGRNRVSIDERSRNVSQNKRVLKMTPDHGRPSPAANYGLGSADDPDAPDRPLRLRSPSRFCPFGDRLSFGAVVVLFGSRVAVTEGESTNEAGMCKKTEGLQK